MNISKTVEENISRINSILNGETKVSEEALAWLTVQADTHGVEGAAALLWSNNIGVCVVDDGESEFLVYGGYQGLHRGNVEYLDAAYCDMETVLDCMTSGDEIPNWWDDSWTFVETERGWTQRGDALQ